MIDFDLNSDHSTILEKDRKIKMSDDTESTTQEPLKDDILDV